MPWSVEPINPHAARPSRWVGAAASTAGSRSHGVQGHVASAHLANNPVKGLIAVLARFSRRRWTRAPPILALEFRGARASMSATQPPTSSRRWPSAGSTSASTTAIRRSRWQAKLRQEAAAVLAGSGLEHSLQFEPPGHAFLTEPGRLDLVFSRACARSPGSRRCCPPMAAFPTRAHQGCLSVIEFGLMTATIHKIDEQVALKDSSSSRRSTGASSTSISMPSAHQMPGDPRPIGCSTPAWGPHRAPRLAARLRKRASSISATPRGSPTAPRARNGHRLRAAGDAALDRGRRQEVVVAATPPRPWRSSR